MEFLVLAFIPAYILVFILVPKNYNNNFTLTAQKNINKVLEKKVEIEKKIVENKVVKKRKSLYHQPLL